MQGIMRRRESEIGEKGFAVALVFANRLDQKVSVAPGGIEVPGQFFEFLIVLDIVSNLLMHGHHSEHVTPVAGPTEKHAE